MPTYVWHCRDTDEYIEVSCKISEIDDFLDTVDNPEAWHRVPQMPNVRTEKLSQSWPDGMVPQSRKAELSDVKQAEKLKIESYGMKPENRGEIKKEIKKLKSIKR